MTIRFRVLALVLCVYATGAIAEPALNADRSVTKSSSASHLISTPVRNSGQSASARANAWGGVAPEIVITGYRPALTVAKASAANGLSANPPVGDTGAIGSIGGVTQIAPRTSLDQKSAMQSEKAGQDSTWGRDDWAWLDAMVNSVFASRTVTASVPPAPQSENAVLSSN